MSDTRSNDLSMNNTHEHNWHAIRRFVLVCALGILIVSLMFWLYYKVMIPVLASAFMAYMISPLVDSLEKRKVNRGLASAFIIIILLGGVTFLAIQLGPLFYDQLTDLVHKVPALVDSLIKSAVATLRDVIRDSGFRDAGNVDRAIRSFNIVEQAMSRFQSAANGIWATGANIMGSLFSAILIPFVTFYLLFEKPRLFQFVRRLTPRDVRPYFADLFRSVDITMKAVVRGHFKVAATLAALYSIGFSAIGMTAGMAIGIAAGICRVIPYLDAVVGIVLGVTYVFTSGLPPAKIFAVLAVVGIVQVLDGAFITPKLIGARVGLHPAVVILTVIAASYHMGFWGVLLAIPIAATAKTVFKMILPVYRDSKWFRDHANP